MTESAVCKPAATIQLCQQQKPLQKFLKGEPKALGVTLIMLGIIQCGFSFPLHFGRQTQMTVVGAPWWMAVLLIVSGSLAIVCDRDPNKPRVTACLATNILTAIAAGLAIIIYSVDLATWKYIHYNERKHDRDYLLLTYGIKVILFVFLVSGFIINLVLSVMCCKGLRYCSPTTNMPVVIVHNPSSENPTCSSSIPAY
ncbi:membrane-spanning 4-domains subfamily A member 15-like [Heterodontus francisci]|uniref:membrane-spanning 4-domains subfamily A member 15-like n=1 Tax=Heterodontus francisci TaxID=7792 RepID=UPI00355BC956